jgi:hypothetical protein
VIDVVSTEGVKIGDRLVFNHHMNTSARYYDAIVTVTEVINKALLRCDVPSIKPDGTITGVHTERIDVVRLDFIECMFDKSDELDAMFDEL